MPKGREIMSFINTLSSTRMFRETTFLDSRFEDHGLSETIICPVCGCEENIFRITELVALENEVEIPLTCNTGHLWSLFFNHANGKVSTSIANIYSLTPVAEEELQARRER